MDLDLSKYPNNSNKAKAQGEEFVEREQKSYDKVVEHKGKLIKGKVIQKKKSAARLAAETFLMKDLGMVKEHMIDDVIKPNLYIGLSDVFHGLIDIIFSDTVAGGLRRNGKKKMTEYDKVSYRDRDYGRASGVGKVTGGGTQLLKARRKGIDLEDLYVESEADALIVLSDLRWRLKEYGEATVYDLYDALGITTDYTNQSWGWENLDEADAVRVRGGAYLLRLPRPKHLKR